MAGVFSTQQSEMDNDFLHNNPWLPLDGARLGSALTSTSGDPMDISPLSAADKQFQHVAEQRHQQQPSEASFQPAVESPNHTTSDTLPRSSSANDHNVKPDDNGNASPGLQTRSTLYRSPSRFSPKDRASVKRTQLKRIPLAMQAKLATPVKPAAAGANRLRSLPSSSNTYSLPDNQHFNNRLAMDGSSSFAQSSFGYNRLHNRPAPVNTQLFKPAAHRLMSANFANLAPSRAYMNQIFDGTAAKPTPETAPTTFTAPIDQTDGDNSREMSSGFSLQRKRLMEESNDIDIRRPAPYVSPKYRKFGESGLGFSSTSSGPLSQQVNHGGHIGLSHKSSAAPPTSTDLISPFKPNLPKPPPRPLFEANEHKPSETWHDMRELDKAFCEQGIAPFRFNPLKKETLNDVPSQSDLSKDAPKTFPYRMPGSWPEDPLNLTELVRERSHLPAQSLGPSGDHGSLMSDALDAPPKLGSTAEQPVASTSPQGTQAPPVSSQEAEAPYLLSSLADQGGQSLPLKSWCDQLHRLYVNSWGVVTTAIDLAGSFKRRAVSLFEGHRPARRSSSPSRTHISSSPTRGNFRTLPDEQRRRLKSNQWRKDRGFPVSEDYPFPQLSLDAPHLPATTAMLSEVRLPPKPIVSEVNTTTPRKKSPVKAARRSDQSGVHKRPLVQTLSPNMRKRMHLRPFKRNFISRLHDTQSGKLDGTQKKFAAVQEQLDHSLSLALKSDKVTLNVHKPKRKPKHAARKKVRFVVPEDPSLVGQHLHQGLPQSKDVAPKEPLLEGKENEPAEPVVREEPQPLDPGLHSLNQFEFPLGKSVSAVRLFASDRQPLPPGRTESIYAAEYRKIQEEEKSQQFPQGPVRIRPDGPAVRPLPPKWEARLAEMKSLPNNRQVATTLSGDALTKRDLATCYTPMAWLNDEIINAYLALLADYLRRAHGNAGRHDKPRFHAFNSFFFSNLRDKGYGSVSRWARRAKIGGESLLDVDTIYIPVHNSAHWTLMVVRPTSRSIEYFDSLGSPSARHVAKVKEWLRGELLDRYIDEEWTVASSVSPQQDNGSDCGVFLLSTAKAIAISLEPLSYGAKDIPLIRRKIVAELMAGGLDGDFNPAGETGEVLM